MSRYACARCRDKGWVEEAVAESGFPPTMRVIPCPDCGGKRVVPMTRREVIEFVLVCAVLIGLVALGAGS
jgi:DNA-directed RNA polymerase subunit RPC12/RpoP